MRDRRAQGRVIVGVQGDEASFLALRWAARCARARKSALEVLMAWELPEPAFALPGGIQAVADDVIGELRWTLEALVDRSGICTGAGLSVSTTVATAPAKVALADAAKRADILVLGAVHHSALAAVLSVGRHTAALAPCPVALVPSGAAAPESSPDDTGDRFVVGMDGSLRSEAALAWAVAEADRRGLAVAVVAVGLSPADLDAVATSVASAGAAHPEVTVGLAVKAGDPGEVLARESWGSEGLVLGQHGGGSFRRHLPSLGSVSRWCAAHPLSPVVIVPAPPAAGGQGETTVESLSR